MKYITSIIWLLAYGISYATAQDVAQKNTATMVPSAYTLDTAMYLMGADDADIYYTGYKLPVVGTVVVSVVGTPILGLIPAIPCAARTPRLRHFKCPNLELLNNPDYVQGYRDEAKALKKRVIWSNYRAVGNGYLYTMGDICEELVIGMICGGHVDHSGSTHCGRR